jgi:hypothetical protein
MSAAQRALRLRSIQLRRIRGALRKRLKKYYFYISINCHALKSFFYIFSIPYAVYDYFLHFEFILKRSEGSLFGVISKLVGVHPKTPVFEFKLSALSIQL